MKSIIYIGIVAVGLSIGGCEKIAIATAPSRVASEAKDQTSIAAQNQFRQLLKNGEYNKLDTSIENLTQVYLKQPNDPRTNLYLGMAHLWAVAERNRLSPVPARIIDQLTLANFYLGEASALQPNDARIVGFQASARMAMGSVHHDESWKRMGYFEAKNAIRDYPEFNLFVLSNSMAQLAPHDPRVNEARDALWKTVDICFDAHVDPARVNASELLAQVIHAQKHYSASPRDRACFNSAIAPHNVEGFFLHFGDVLAKTGSEKNARIMYQLAGMIPSANNWPYQKVAQTRLQELAYRLEQFHHAKSEQDEPEIMARSAYACVACHQQ